MRLVSWIAIGLWLVTIAVGGMMFVRGSTLEAEDGRTLLVLDEAEKALVLTEMRTMLLSVEGIVTALPDNDLEVVADAARKSGMGMQKDIPGSLMMKLPLEFKQLGMATHTGFDEIAAAAGDGETTQMILDRLGENLSRCVACHALYRVN